MSSQNRLSQRMGFEFPLDRFECIRQPLYDTVEMWDPVFTQFDDPEPDVEEKWDRKVPWIGTMNFFSTPIGQPHVSTARAKTFLDTNMFLANQLPYGQGFKICGISLIFVPGRRRDAARRTRSRIMPWISQRQEIQDFYSFAHLSLRIGSKMYLEIPAVALCPWYYADMLRAVDAESYEGLLTRLADTDRTTYDRLFRLDDKELLLQANQNFSVEVKHPPFPAFQKDGTRRVRVILEGDLFRINR